MASRDSALARARTFFDSNGFRDRLAALVAIPSTSQDPGHQADVQRYLAVAIQPWLERMGFTVEIHPNPVAGFGPILFAERLEGPDRPTVLTYGHGDTVRGLEDQWREGLSPWTLTEEGDHWYGRGSADNKGQHALNLSALEAVLAERGSVLGFNVKLILETSEERGSTGLRAFVAEHAEPAGRGRADRQRRAAGDAGGADDRDRHAGNVSLRSGGGFAAGRRALRALGWADSGPGDHPKPRVGHDHGPER